jgi:hypothetical protein
LKDRNSLSLEDIMNKTKRTVADDKTEDITNLLDDEIFD